uniref:Synaptophysin / synaptoporin domain containing protein n=1 Tax=Rhipicephalus zambeziensis TaxID=60191 RepID=A0A224Z0F7_9ACAR
MSINPALKKFRIWVVDMGKPSEEDGAPKIQANVGYAKSRDGVFQIIEMVVGLVAFICVESVAECRGAFNCAPPGCVHSYRFFALVSFASVLVTAAIFAARMLGVAHRVPVPVRYRPLVERLYLIITIVLYFFADAFIIAFHGNRLGYQCAAVLGVATLAAYCVHLALLMAEAPLGRLLPKLSAKTKAGSGTKEDSGSQLSWEPPAGVDDADGAAPQLGPVVLRPRRSSVDSGGGGGGARRPAPPDSKESSPSSLTSSRSSSDCAETASVHSANFVTVNLDDVTQPPGSSEVPS